MIDAARVWQLGAASEIEGRTTGSETSVIVVDMPPWPGPAWHRHPYVETFIVLEGRARFTIEGRTSRLPSYQRNDDLHWIKRSVRAATKRKRIDQMLEELKAGGVYMGMAHRPSKHAR